MQTVALRYILLDEWRRLSDKHVAKCISINNLRNADFNNIPRFRTLHYGKHSLQYFGPRLWNKLDKNDREKPNVKSFINSIKSKDLIDNCKNCDICLLGRFTFLHFIYI